MSSSTLTAALTAALTAEQALLATVRTATARLDAVGTSTLATALDGLDDAAADATRRLEHAAHAVDEAFARVRDRLASTAARLSAIAGGLAYSAAEAMSDGLSLDAARAAEAEAQVHIDTITTAYDPFASDEVATEDAPAHDAQVIRVREILVPADIIDPAPEMAAERQPVEAREPAEQVVAAACSPVAEVDEEEVESEEADGGHEPDAGHDLGGEGCDPMSLPYEEREAIARGLIAADPAMLLKEVSRLSGVSKTQCWRIRNEVRAAQGAEGGDA